MSFDQTPPLTRAEARKLREHETAPEPTTKAPRRGRFAITLIAVLTVLGLASVGLAVFSLTQGPRLSSVIVNPGEAVELSGSRVILIANQPLHEISANQVTVSPEVPFTLDAVGRNIGIRFTVPLDENTEYTVSVSDVSGIGGGPSATFSTTFTTPGVQLYVLQRSTGDDTIFSTNLAEQSAKVLFTHPRISAFRHLDDVLIVSVEENEADRILVVNLAGEVVRELDLPGDGFVQDLQVSDRGGLVGYVYTDRNFTEDTGYINVLVMQSITSGEAQIVDVLGVGPSIAEWQFVPDTSSALFIDFESTMFVVDGTTPSAPTSLGVVLSILGIERGTYVAIVMDAEGKILRRDLADGSETELAPSVPDFGPPQLLTPYPGGTVQQIVLRDDIGMPMGQLVVRIEDNGTATALFEVGTGDAVLQACTSPSGQYVSVTVAPDLVNNPYDDMVLAMPERTESHIINMRTGEGVVVLAGFNASWCERDSHM